jgi:hypothetical protein
MKKYNEEKGTDSKKLFLWLTIASRFRTDHDNVTKVTAIFLKNNL